MTKPVELRRAAILFLQLSLSTQILILERLGYTVPRGKVGDVRLAHEEIIPNILKEIRLSERTEEFIAGVAERYRELGHAHVAENITPKPPEVVLTIPDEWKAPPLKLETTFPVEEWNARNAETHDADMEKLLEAVERADPAITVEAYDLMPGDVVLGVYLPWITVIRRGIS